MNELRTLAHNRPFLRFFASQALLWFGSAGTTIALLFAMLDSDLGVSGAGLLLAARAIPSVALGLVGGVFADRYSRRTVMLACTAAAAVAQGSIAALLITDRSSLPLLLGGVVLLGSAQSLCASSVYATTPTLVTGESIQQAQSAMRFVRNASSIVGPGAGGLVVATLGPGWVIGFDSLCAAASALVLLTIPLRGSASGRPGAWTDLAVGWRYVRHNDWLLVSIPAFSLALLAWTAGFGVVAPASVVTDGGSARTWGLIGSALAVGYLAGSLIGLRWVPRDRVTASVLAQAVTALPLMAVALSAPVAAVVLAAAVAGTAMDLAGVWWATAMQTRVPSTVLGRVSSFDYVGSFGLMPLGYLAAPWLLDLIGPGAAMWGLAATIVIATTSAVTILARSDRRRAPLTEITVGSPHP